MQQRLPIDGPPRGMPPGPPGPPGMPPAPPPGMPPPGLGTLRFFIVQCFFEI